MVKELFGKSDKKSDRAIWGIIIVLFMVSIVEVFSASSREISDGRIYEPILGHVIHLGIGLVLILLFERIHYKHLRLLTVVAVVGSLVLLVWTLLGGAVVNGAKRSVRILGHLVQTVDFAKLSLVLFLALVLAMTQEKKGVSNDGVKWCAGVVLLFCALLLPQGLTNTLLMMAISLSMMLVGGVQFKKWFLVIGVYLVLAVAAYGVNELVHDSIAEEQVLTEGDKSGTGLRSVTWSTRMKEFFGDGTPEYEKQINDRNRQSHYAAMAVAHGGFFGVMPGNSREVSRLPLAFSDFIYAIIIEEFGLLGGIILLATYLFLLIRAGMIAYKCKKAYPALLIVGLALMITLQALANMAIAVGLVPVSGQPLPLISKGGMSICITCIALGIMLSVSRNATKESNDQIKGVSESGLPEDLQASNPTGIK